MRDSSKFNPLGQHKVAVAEFFPAPSALNTSDWEGSVRANASVPIRIKMERQCAATVAPAAATRPLAWKLPSCDGTPSLPIEIAARTQAKARQPRLFATSRLGQFAQPTEPHDYAFRNRQQKAQTHVRVRQNNGEVFRRERSEDVRKQFTGRQLRKQLGFGAPPAVARVSATGLSTGQTVSQLVSGLPRRGFVRRQEKDGETVTALLGQGLALTWQSLVSAFASKISLPTSRTAPSTQQRATFERENRHTGPEFSSEEEARAYARAYAEQLRLSADLPHSQYATRQAEPGQVRHSAQNILADDEAILPISAMLLFSEQIGKFTAITDEGAALIAAMLGGSDPCPALRT